MSELVVLDGFSLLPQGPTLSLSLSAGQSMCIVGPAASGKSRLLAALQGRERAGQGRASLMTSWIVASREGFGRRATPTSVARGWADRRAGDASGALTAAGLWAVRAKPIDGLSPSQTASAELLGSLASAHPILFVDGQLDVLDAWTLGTALEAFREKLRHGAALIAATNRLELCPFFDIVVVMCESRAAFAGSVEELLREADETELVVESRSQRGVRALVEPFEVAIQPTQSGVRLEATEGQAIAAKLLMEGYGDVRTVTLLPPTIEAAVRRIVGRQI